MIRPDIVVVSTATKGQDMGWDDVEAALPETKAIAFDGCHKIYMLLDDAQVKLMYEYGYADEGSFLLEANAFPTRGAMLGTLHEWFDESCGLRFVNSVRTVDGDPNDGFTTLIGQFEFDDADEEEDDESLYS